MGYVGRPPKFESADQIQELVDAYFEDCAGQVWINPENGLPAIDKNGNEIRVGKHPPTVTGLALALGFSDRCSLLDYEGKKEFSLTIKKAKARVEEYAERRLFDRDGQRGAEFSLRCNFKRWTETKEKDDDDRSVTGVIVIPEIKRE